MSYQVIVIEKGIFFVSYTGEKVFNFSDSFSFFLYKTKKPRNC